MDAASFEVHPAPGAGARLLLLTDRRAKQTTRRFLEIGLCVHKSPGCNRK